MARYAADEALFTRPAVSTYKPLLTAVAGRVSVPASTAVMIVAPLPDNVLDSGADTVPGTGVNFYNNSAFTVYYSPYGTATANDVPLGAGESIFLPQPTKQGVSLYNPNATTAADIRGYSW